MGLRSDFPPFWCIGFDYPLAGYSGSARLGHHALLSFGWIGVIVKHQKEITFQALRGHSCAVITA